MSHLNIIYSEQSSPIDFQSFGGILGWAAFFSPTLLIFVTTFLSFIFQNFKGLIYLGFIIAVSVVRIYLYGVFDIITPPTTHKLCRSVLYGNYGNTTYSVFIFAFTLMYLFLPMFINGAYNWWIFSALVCYSIIDFLVRRSYSCYTSTSEILLNIICGGGLAAAIIMAMYAGGSAKFLFFNEMNTGTDTCSRPANQQFKCKAYKNGELLGSVPHP